MNNKRLLWVFVALGAFLLIYIQTARQNTPSEYTAPLPQESAAETSPSASTPIDELLPATPAFTQGYILHEAPAHQMPARVDSNSPVFWDGDTIIIFNSVGLPYRSAGLHIERLSEAKPVTFLNDPPLPGMRWLEAAWKDEATGTLYGWYHLEPNNSCQTAPLIGALISRDNGLTWRDQGLVLQSAYPADCSYSNGYFTGGNGDFSVIPDQEGRYFYFLFSHYAGPPEEQGVAIAQSAFEDRGQPGTVWKYFNGEWSEPGISGRAAPIFTASKSWRGPELDALWGPSVHWNTYLERYVVLLNRADAWGWHQEGIYIAFSKDLLTWTAPEKILGDVGWYPQIVGLGPKETDKLAGQFARLYIHGKSQYIIEFTKE